MEELKNKNIHIVGVLGNEGFAMFDFCLGSGFKNITGHDFSSPEKIEEIFKKSHPNLSNKEIENNLNIIKKNENLIHFQENYLQDVKKADLIFLPQSWFLYKQNKPLKKLKRKIPFWGILNLYFQTKAKIIGVTGSQGKTTTTRLIENIFSKSKNRFLTLGNDKFSGNSIKKALNLTDKDFLILEISHRQLLFDIKNSPDISVILNITQNHLDDFLKPIGEKNNIKEAEKEYIKTKEKLLKYQKKQDFAILNYEDKNCQKLIKKYQNKINILTFSHKQSLKKGIFIKNKSFIIKYKNNEKKIAPINSFKLIGTQNIEDALAAIGASFCAKIPLKSIKEGIETFQGPKEKFHKEKEINGIEFYVDFLSTTPESTIPAIKFFNKKIYLICGGEDKEMNYKNLAKLIEKKVKKVILLPGTASNKIQRELATRKNKIEKVKSLEEAIEKVVRLAKRELKNNKNQKEIVLISPAAAFFRREYGGQKKLKEIFDKY